MPELTLDTLTCDALINSTRRRRWLLSGFMSVPNVARSLW